MHVGDITQIVRKVEVNQELDYAIIELEEAINDFQRISCSMVNAQEQLLF